VEAAVADESVNIEINAKNLTEQAFRAAKKDIDGLKGTAKKGSEETKGFGAKLAEFFRGPVAGSARDTSGLTKGLGADLSAFFRGPVAGAATIVAGAAAAAGVAIAGVTAAVIALGDRGSAVSDVREQFTGLAARAGESADVMLGKLRDGVGRTITDFDLMTAGTKALQSGLIRSSEDMSTLAQGARLLAERGFGPAQENLQRLTNTIAAGEPGALKQMGIFVSAQQAAAAYARTIGKSVEDLTEQEKAAGVARAAIAQLSAEVQAAGPIADDFSDHLSRWRTNVANIKDRLGELIAASPVFLSTMEQIGESFTRAFGSEREQQLVKVVNALELGSIYAIELAKTGLTAAEVLHRGFKLAGAAVASLGVIITDALHGLVQIVDVSAQLQAKIPGIGKAYEGVAAATRRARDSTNALAFGMRGLLDDLADAAAGGGNMNETLRTMRERLDASLRQVVNAGLTYQGMGAAAKDAAANVGDLGDDQDESSASALRHAAAVDKLRAQLSGDGLAGDLRTLTEAWGTLTPAQQAQETVIRAALAQYEKFRSEVTDPSALPAELEGLRAANEHLTADWIKRNDQLQSSIQKLQASLTGSGAVQEIEALKAAWAGLTPAQRSHEGALANVVAQYGKLRAQVTDPSQLPSALEALRAANTHLTDEWLKNHETIASSFRTLQDELTLAQTEGLERRLAEIGLARDREIAGLAILRETHAEEAMLLEDALREKYAREIEAATAKESSIVHLAQQAGFATRADLQRTATTAIQLHQRMLESGLFTETQLLEASQRAEAAKRLAKGETAKYFGEQELLVLETGTNVLQALGVATKSLAIAQTIISGLQGIGRTWAMLGWPAAIPGTIVIAASTAANVAKIKSTPAFQTGTRGLDFQDFGRESMVRVHGREAIIPERGGGHRLGQEVASEVVAALAGAGGGSPNIYVTINAGVLTDTVRKVVYDELTPLLLDAFEGNRGGSKTRAQRILQVNPVTP
jgi:hypothetical protein